MLKFFLCGITINTILFYSFNNNKQMFYTINIFSISYLLTYNVIYLI